MSAEKSLFALLAGAAAGFTLGVLFAPDKGEVTRKKVREAAEEGAHDLHVRARYARKEMNSLKHTLADQGEELGENLRSKLLAQLDKLEKALERDDVDAEDPIVDEQ